MQCFTVAIYSILFCLNLLFSTVFHSIFIVILHSATYFALSCYIISCSDLFRFIPGFSIQFYWLLLLHFLHFIHILFYFYTVLHCVLCTIYSILLECHFAQLLSIKLSSISFYCYILYHHFISFCCYILMCSVLL